MKRFIIISILSFFTFVSLGQSSELLPFKWKNRVLVIMSEKHTDELVQRQIDELLERKEALVDRKMVIISTTPASKKVHFPEEASVKPSNIYSDIKLWDDPFEVVLLGLDGDAKERNIRPVDPQKLFDFIDTMPMRKAELDRE